MKLRYNLLGLAAAAAMATGGLQAQDSEFTIKLGLLNPMGDLKTGTTQVDRGSSYPTRYDNAPVLQTKGPATNIEIGWDLVPSKDLGIGIGVQAGFMNFPADTSVPYGATAKAGYFGVDLIYQFAQTALTIRTGPLMASWDIQQKTGVNPATQQPVSGSSGALGETTFKLGWRLGAEYKITPKWSAGVTWGFTGWKTAINPSWLGVQAGYRFNF